MAIQDDDIKVQINKIGARLKEIRKQRGYTSYEHFANEHNISRMQYWRYEKGEDLRISSLLKVLKAHDMSLNEFFSEDI